MSKNVGPRRGPQAPDPGWLPEVFGYKCFPRPRGPEHKRVRCPEACGTGCQRWRRGQEEVQTWVPVTQTREAEGLVVTAQVQRAPDRPAGCPSLGTTRHTHTPNPRVAAPPAVPPTPRRPPRDACSLAGAAPALGVWVEGSGRGRARLSDRGIWGSEGPVGGQPLGDPPTSGSRVRSRACPGGCSWLHGRLVSPGSRSDVAGAVGAIRHSALEKPVLAGATGRQGLCPPQHLKVG